MKPWRLTQQAESSLREIANWTVKQFGKQQARKYRNKLIQRIDQIASVTHSQSKSCSNLINDSHNELFYVREGSHFIIFRETKEQLEILEFFHQRMNIPMHIKNLEDKSY